MSCCNVIFVLRNHLRNWLHWKLISIHWISLDRTNGATCSQWQKIRPISPMSRFVIRKYVKIRRQSTAKKMREDQVRIKWKLNNEKCLKTRRPIQSMGYSNSTCCCSNDRLINFIDFFSFGSVLNDAGEIDLSQSLSSVFSVIALHSTGSLSIRIPHVISCINYSSIFQTIKMTSRQTD